MNAPVPEPENVPAELREREQWLMWDANADKPRRPHWRGDFSVSWSDPDDWHTFEEAVEAANERDSWGIGYVFAANNDNHALGVYGSLDLDGCVGEDGRPKEWLPSLQPFFDNGAFMEYSPSGEGIHIPLAGFKPPEWWSDSHFTDDEHEGVEAYGSKFFTFTGDKLRNSGDSVAETGEWVEEWLVQAYKAITGEDPHEGGTPDEQPSRDYGHGSGWFDAETAADALEYIDPDVTYSTWRDIGFALADEYPETRALSLFKDWSRGGSKWDSEAEKQAERIVEDSSPGGGRSIATVVHYAKEGGWEPETARSPDDSSSEGTTTDGGTAAASASTDGPTEPETTNRALTPMNVMAAAGLAEDEDLSKLTDPQKAYFVYRLIEQSDDHHLIAAQPDGEILRYDEGLWSTDGEQRLREIAAKALGSEYTRKVFRELKEQVRAYAPVQRDAMGAPAGTVATETGLLDLETRDLRDLNPEDHALFRLGTGFDPEADCPRFKEFLGEVVRPEDLDALQEYAGYCLHHWGQPYKRAILLLGPQDSGKSTFLHIIKAILGGSENVSSENLNSLVNTRWGAANLYGSVANVANELETTELESTNLFKTITGAGDYLTAERKGEDPFQFVPKAKHLFATNRVPPANGADDAFFSRWLFATFPQSVPASEQVRDLDEQLLEAERAGILNWMLDGYDRLRDQDGFTGDGMVGAKRERWEMYGNSVERFKHNCLEVTGDAGDVVVKEIAHEFYARYCREKAGTEVETQAKLTRELKKDKNITDGRRKVRPGGKQWTAYVGIKFHPAATDALGFDPGAALEDLRAADGEDDTDGDDGDDGNGRTGSLRDYGDE